MVLIVLAVFVSPQNLETLAVTFQTGRVQPADLAPLEQLRKLKALSLVGSRQAEEGGVHCLAGFPESLLKLKGLTSLAISSQGEGEAAPSVADVCCVSSGTMALVHEYLSCLHLHGDAAMFGSVQSENRLLVF